VKRVMYTQLTNLALNISTALLGLTDNDLSASPDKKELFSSSVIKTNSGTQPAPFEEWCLLGCYAVWLIRTDVSEELSASFIKVTRIGELGTALAVGC
jgi:hypothetical protein